MILTKDKWLKHLRKAKAIGWIREITGDINCYILKDGYLVDCFTGQNFNIEDFLYFEYYATKREDLEDIEEPAATYNLQRMMIFRR